MVQGTFFKVDTDSLLGEGQVVFRYLPVCRRPHDESKKHHHFPVYAVLKPFSIDFYYHGPDIEKDANKEDIHVHACILHLPLSLNLAVKDNLTARLSQSFHGYFELNDEYEFELPKTRQTYWNLDVFSGEKGGVESECEEGKHILKRKLILDFIFDLEHSRVFEASPHYEEVEVHLRENFFFNAIAAKAAYYYNRQLYLDSWRDDDVSELYAHNLFNAEIQWLNILRDSRSTEAFWNENWFINVEHEYEHVLFKPFKRSKWRESLNATSDPFLDKQNIRILRESVRWFLRRYSLINGVRAILQYKELRRLWLIPLILFSFIVFPNILSIHNNQSGVIAKFVYVLAGFIPFLIVSLGLMYRKMFLPILGAMLPRLLMAIASAWILFTTAEELWKESFDVRLFYNFWVILLIIPVLFFIGIEIRNMAPDIDPWPLTRRILYILLIGFFYSILIGIFFTGFSAKKMITRCEYLKIFYEIQNKDSHDGAFTFRDTALLGQILNAKSFDDREAFEHLDKFRYKFKFLGLSENDSLNIMYKIRVLNDDFRLYVFPGMLLFRSLFALFIGIFIQLIFEDKPITEPL